MKKLSKADKERLKKHNDMYLYEVGYELVDKLNDETNELLEVYKEIDVPVELDNWFDNYSEELQSKEKWNKQKQKIMLLLRRTAAILIFAIITATILTMGVEAYRVRFFNMLLETTKKSTTVEYTSDTEEVSYELLSDLDDYYYLSFVPDGYDLLDVKILDTTIIMSFSGEEENIIRFKQGDLGAVSHIDTENAEITTVEINGKEAILSVKEDVSIIAWSNNICSFTIVGEVNHEEIIKMAESIRKK